MNEADDWRGGLVVRRRRGESDGWWLSESDCEDSSPLLAIYVFQEVYPSLPSPSFFPLSLFCALPPSLVPHPSSACLSFISILSVC